MHVLHLNAGVGGGTASLLDQDTSSWHHVVGVNLLGVGQAEGRNCDQLEHREVGKQRQGLRQ